MKAQIFRLALLSYRQSGLLQLASERLLFLNDPNAECRALGASYGFGILTPAAVFAAPHRFPIINRENPRAHLNAVAGGSKSRPRDSAYAPVSPDVALSGETVTVGTAMSFLFQALSTEQVLFLEGDFVVGVPPDSLRAQLEAAALLRGAGLPLTRLQSRATINQPGGLDAPCCSAASATPHRECRYRLHGGSWARSPNWRNFYCDADMPARGAILMATCVRRPTMRCFYSTDANWSNRPFLADRRWFVHAPLEPSGVDGVSSHAQL